MRPEQERVKQLLTEAVLLLCRNSLQFTNDVTVEGLLGITLDKRDIFLVSINETIQSLSAQQAEQAKPPQPTKRNNDDSFGDTESPGKKKRRKRRSSRDSSASPPPSPVPPAQPDRLHENVKQEQHSFEQERETVDQRDNNSDNWNEDGRKYHPAHDSTSQDEHRTEHRTEKPQSSKRDHSNLPASASSSSLSRQDHGTISVRQPSGDNGDGQLALVKNEPEEEEDECFLIEDDDSDTSHTSGMQNYMPGDHPNMSGMSWASGDGGDSSFGNLSELDMMSAANFQQQFSNLSALAGGSGGMQGMPPGSLPPGFNPGAMVPSGSGQDQPSTSGGPDGSQRVGNFTCPACQKTFTQMRNLKRHFDTIHRGIEKYTCMFCGRKFGRTDAMKIHQKQCSNQEVILHQS